MSFIPAVFEADGGIGGDASAVLKDLFADAARRSGVALSAVATRGRQRIAMALQQANAIALLRHRPPPQQHWAPINVATRADAAAARADGAPPLAGAPVGAPATHTAPPPPATPPPLPSAPAAAAAVPPPPPPQPSRPPSPPPPQPPLARPEAGAAVGDIVAPPQPASPALAGAQTAGAPGRSPHSPAPPPRRAAWPPAPAAAPIPGRCVHGNTSSSGFCPLCRQGQ
jgi:hypothetical protein